MNLVPAQGASFSWGTTNFVATSIQVNAVSGGEVDITSMSSETVTDPSDAARRLIVPDYDTYLSARYGTDLSVEFYVSPDITAANYFDVIGRKRQFTLSLPLGEGAQAGQVGMTINKSAILTQMQLSAATGDFVRGSATFRVTGR